MKSIYLKLTLVVMAALMSGSAFSQTTKKEKKLVEDAKLAIEEFVKTDSNMEQLIKDAYGYVIFPSVGKGGFGVGAALGNGVAYEGGELIGKATLTQLNIGFQLGGQVYREIILFETEEAFDRFKEDEFEFAAQASAIALKTGVSVNAKYRDGVLIFTQQKGGLMYEASIGGQKFNFDPFEK